MDVNEEATELEFLKWFYQNADFGPADSDVRDSLKDIFEHDTGRCLPVGYRRGE